MTRRKDGGREGGKEGGRGEDQQLVPFTLHHSVQGGKVTEGSVRGLRCRMKRQGGRKGGRKGGREGGKEGRREGGCVYRDRNLNVNVLAVALEVRIFLHLQE